MAVLTPFAIDATLQPYPPAVLVGVIPVVWVFTALVAFPLYVALPTQRQAQLTPLLLAGFLSAFLSYALFHVVFLHPSFEQVGSTIFVKDGSLTAAGWRNLLRQTALMGVVGAIGGSTLWVVRRLTIAWSGRES